MLELGKPLSLAALTEPVVAVIQLHTQKPGILHQVVLRPDKVAGVLIRLGETPGDEANGWQFPQNITVLWVLGRAVETGDGKWKCVPFAEPLEKAA